MPLRVGLAALVSTIAALILAIAGSVFLHRSETAMREAIDSQLSSAATSLTGAAVNDPGRFSAIAAGELAVRVYDSELDLVWSSWEARQVCPDVDWRWSSMQRPQSEIFSVCVSDDQAWRLLVTPVRDDVRNRTAVLAMSLEPAAAARARMWRTLWFMVGPGVILAWLGAWALAGAALRPVERMRREAASMGGSDEEARLAVPGTRDEVAALAGTFNDLLDRIYEASARERDFVADAGHELRTPLTILRAELELASRPGRSSQELREAISVAQSETDRLIRLAEDLLFLAKSSSGSASLQVVSSPVSEAIIPSVRAISAAAMEQGVEVQVIGDLSIKVMWDVERIRQAMDNVLANALRHTSSGQITVRVQSLAGTNLVEIAVADTGEGFPEDFLAHAFTRFRRADSARGRDNGGAGLGLAIVRSIVEAHGGSAAVANAPGGGAQVTLTLPQTLAPN